MSKKAVHDKKKEKTKKFSHLQNSCIAFSVIWLAIILIFILLALVTDTFYSWCTTPSNWIVSGLWFVYTVRFLPKILKK